MLGGFRGDENSIILVEVFVNLEDMRGRWSTTSICTTFGQLPGRVVSPGPVNGCKLLARASERLAPPDLSGRMEDDQTGDDMERSRYELEALRAKRDGAIGKITETIDRGERGQIA